jgi:hypothetical protein
MREIEILTFRDEYKEVDNRIMGVKKEGEEIILEQGTSFDALSTITSLEEELNQSDRFMEKADAG